MRLDANWRRLVRRHWGGLALVLLTIALSLAVVLLPASCGGGRKMPEPILTPPPPPPPPPPPEEPEELTEYEEAVAERVEPWTSPDKGALGGTIAVEGLTILDPQTLEPAQEEERLSEVVTRIVDPEDNIGSVQIPDPDGSFLHPDLTPLAFAVLQVEFLVAEDVDADGSGNDTVQVEVPVSVAASVQTTVDLSVSGTGAGTFGDLSIPPELGQVEGVPIKLTYHVLDPRGERDALLGLMLNLRRLAIDRDGNGTFDREDPVESDTDRNAFGDASEQDFLAGARMMPPVELSFEGRVVKVDDGRLHIFDPTMDRMRLVHLNFHVSVLAGLDGRPLRLTPALVGRRVFVHALALPEGKTMALLVLVLGE